jgi:hypothetical protein
MSAQQAYVYKAGHESKDPITLERYMDRSRIKRSLCRHASDNISRDQQRGSKKSLAYWPEPVPKTPRLGVLMDRRCVMERRKFTREFKLEAVRLIKERGVSYTQASDLGVHQSQLRVG